MTQSQLDGDEADAAKKYEENHTGSPYDRSRTASARLMIPTFHVRYSGPSSGSRYDKWREEFASKWISADFEPIGSDRFVSEVTGSTHSFVSIYTARGTPMYMARRPDTPSTSEAFLYVMMASASQIQILQRNELHDLAPGQMALLSADEPASGSQLTEGVRTSLRIPRKLLAEMTRLLDDKIGKPIVAPPELRQLLLHQVELAQRLGPKLDAAANFSLAQHVLDLAALCIGAHKDATQLAARRGLTAARLDAIKVDILNNIATSDVRLGQLAARHKLSERYVQYLFEMTGTSFTGFILEQRLLRAWRLLRDPSNQWRKISDIATAAGFSDISYFNRAFRSRFGATPSDIRACADAGNS